MLEHQPGDLVIYERDMRHAAAWTLYAVLGEAKPDRDGNLQIRIQALSRVAQIIPRITTWEPMDVAAKDCTPLADYGMSVRRIAAPGTVSSLLAWQIWLWRDETLTPTAKRKFGKQNGSGWDWCHWTMIDDDKIGELVAHRLAEQAQQAAA